MNQRTPGTSGSSGQASDQDLTDIAALSPANDDVIQRKSGAWTNRTPAQIKTDLALTKTDVGLANVPNTDATDRANHTGTQSADTLTDGTTNKAFLATERTKLSGIATAATANSSDAVLEARANHTGTQTASTVSDFSTAADARITAATGVSVEAHDADLTTIAGLTATTDNILMSVSSAWASRTPVQVRAALGVGIGFNAPTGAYLQPSHMQTSAAGTPTTGRALFMPVDVGPSSITLQSLSVNVTTALVVGSGNGVFTLGVYSDDGTGGAPLLSAPGLLFSGTLDPTSTGARHVTTSTVLSAGKRYWTAFLLYQTVAPTTPAAFSCLLSTTSLWSTSGSVPGAAARALLATGQTALPTSAVTWAVTASTEAPVVCPRVA